MIENINMVVHVEGKKFIGIGKFYFDSHKIEWNIPHLHFMVDQHEQGHFEATVLELCLVASGNTEKDAIQHLADITRTHIISVMTRGNGFQEFINIVKTHAMDDYWAAYRVIEFTLAERGEDLSHAFEREIAQAILKMDDEKIKQILIKSINQAVDEILKEYEEASAFKFRDLEYNNIQEIA